MIYKEFHGKKLSALGLGCMRLPVVDGVNSAIDEAATFAMVDYAIEHGINYFDTAWGYHDGYSETVMGKALSRYSRDQYYLADKFPGYDLENFGKHAVIFEEQLKKCATEYFDFYLFHNVCEMNIEQYLDPNSDLHPFLLEKKAKGRIRHLGFSIHGTLETTKRFLDAFSDCIDFCQIQLNWLDWDFQAAKAKVALLKERNIPIWVMEPVRGGSLLQLDEKHTLRLKALHPDWTLAEWAFRFLQSIPGVTVTLSGMSNMAQLKENIQTFSSEVKLSAEEIELLFQIAKEKTGVTTVPCTACRYCTTHCPIGLDIPELLQLYNEHSYSEGGFIAPMALSAMPADKQPSSCLGCRSCEAVCPQEIKISEALSDFSKKLQQ